ncbi:MAG: hypothetical protein HYY84_03850 [Deltaproteobacteria bacterium]|nr:hypothetical protein [Deltaproteobacteria bacterium]
MSSIFDFKTKGGNDAPDEYELVFNGRGLARAKDDAIVVLERHVCEVRLGTSYPRMKPDLTWKSRIYHPNISESGMVCLGGYSTHWVPSLQLDELCEMLWDMIRFANYDTRSAYNYAAGKWLLSQRGHTFPLDPRPLRDRVASGEVRLEDSGTVVLDASAAKKVRAPKKPAPHEAAEGEVVFFSDETDAQFNGSGADDDLLVIKE